MRVGSFSMYDQAANLMDQDLASMTQLQNQLSTGNKFSKNSDDVTGVITAMDYNLDLNQDSRYLSNINSANNILGNASTAMSSTVDALNSAKEMALEGANGTENNSDLASLAQQVYQIRDQLLGYANSKTATGESVFAGFQTGTDAFNGTTYAYQGDSGVANEQISGSQTVALNVPGSTAFSYYLQGPVTQTLSDGTTVTYTPTPATGGTTVNVQITNTSTNLNESFSFSNFMQMANQLGDALNTGDREKVNALLTPLDDAIGQALQVNGTIGAGQDRLTSQQNLIVQDQADTQTLLSNVQDADMAQTATGLAKYQTALQALEQSTASISSQNLLDFLK